MRCSNCGFENKDSSRFCGNCGYDLQKQEIVQGPYQDQGPRKSNKKLIIGVVLAFVVLIGLGIYFIYSSNKNGKIQRLEADLEIERLDNNYERMVEINQDLYQLTKDEKYKKEVDRITALKNNEDKSTRVRTLIDQDQYKEALKMIKSLEKSEDKNAEDLDLLYTSFETNLNTWVDDKITYGDHDGAIRVLEDLLTIDTSSQYLKGLLDTTKAAKEDLNKKIASEEKKQAEEERLEKERKQREQEEFTRKASSTKADSYYDYEDETYYIGNTGYINVEKAYLRQTPKWKSKTVGYWIYNDEVTFYDVKLYDGTIWVNTHATKNWWVPADELIPVDQD